MADEDLALMAEYATMARDMLGGGVATGEALYGEGIANQRGGVIGETTIDNWCQGVARMFPDAAMALARLTGLSLDRLAGLYGKREVGPLEPQLQDEAARRELADRFEAIEGTMRGMRDNLRRQVEAGGRRRVR